VASGTLVGDTSPLSHAFKSQADFGVKLTQI